MNLLRANTRGRSATQEGNGLRDWSSKTLPKLTADQFWSVGNKRHVAISGNLWSQVQTQGGYTCACYVIGAKENFGVKWLLQGFRPTVLAT